MIFHPCMRGIHGFSSIKKRVMSSLLNLRMVGFIQRLHPVVSYWKYLRRDFFTFCQLPDQFTTPEGYHMQPNLVLRRGIRYWHWIFFSPCFGHTTLAHGNGPRFETWN